MQTADSMYYYLMPTSLVIKVSSLHTDLAIITNYRMAHLAVIAQLFEHWTSFNVLGSSPERVSPW